MYKILFASLILIFTACQTDTQTPTENQTDAQATPVTLPQKKEETRQPKRSNYTVDKARPKSKMNKEFPYDIDLKDVNGKVLSSEAILKKNGKPTVLLFWLTTCYPCRIEMKAIEGKFADWEKEADFNFVAVSTDFSKNYEKFVKRVNESNWPWETYNDVNREFRNVMPGGLNGLPQTFLLDKNGQIVYHKRKYVSGDEDTLFDKIKQIASN